MAMIRPAVQPTLQTDRRRDPGGVERAMRDLSHGAMLAFAVTSVAIGILACISLFSQFGIGASSSFIVVAILFPLLCGWLAKERWRAKGLEDQIKRLQADDGSPSGLPRYGDNTPAGILILSSDLRIWFTGQTYFEGGLQGPHEVLGWKIQDVVPVAGIEDRAKALLGRCDPAASCCFDALVRAGLAGERPVHITMTRIASRQGEDRVLVVVEDLPSGCSPQSHLPVEGYVC